MNSDTGLFAWVRKTSLTYFIIVWLVSILFFGILYWFFLPLGNLALQSVSVEFTFLGLLKAIYVSFLVAVLVGLGALSYSGIYTIFVYIQLILSAIVLLVIAGKILYKFIDVHAHTQDKKVNTLMLMLSTIRGDMDKIMHDHKINKKHIRVTDVESLIDGVYVVFLDVETLFSASNIHRHKLKTHQYLMLTENIEDSLQRLHKFIHYMEHHNMKWKDKSVEFWMHYIMDTSDKMVSNLEDSNLKNTRIAAAVADIKEISGKMREII